MFYIMPIASQHYRKTFISSILKTSITDYTFKLINTKLKPILFLEKLIE